MNTIEPVTPDEAAIVWRSIRNPSARSVARALSQAGRRIHHSTIARWRSQGWRAVTSGPHPIEAARDALEVAARLLTGDPAIGADGVVHECNAEQLELTDRELVRRSTRELLILQIVLCDVIRGRSALLLQERLSETAMLVNALANVSRAASYSLPMTDRLSGRVCDRRPLAACRTWHHRNF
jgi:hypothetical protein